VPARPAPLWRGADWALLLVSLAALIAGSFPEWFLPSHVSRAMPAPPALSVLLAAQAGFVLAFCPLLLAPRAGRALWRYLAETIGEYALVLVASVPLYVTAAWLSNAAAGDVIRSVAHLTTVALAAWGLGLLFQAGGAAACVAALAAVIGVVGTTAACYLLAELADSPPGWAWLADLSPVLRAFRLARPSATWLPGPGWSWLAWPAVGLVAALLAAVVGKRDGTSRVAPSSRRLA